MEWVTAIDRMRVTQHFSVLTIRNTHTREEKKEINNNTWIISLSAESIVHMNMNMNMHMTEGKLLPEGEMCTLFFLFLYRFTGAVFMFFSCSILWMNFEHDDMLVPILESATIIFPCHNFLAFIRLYILMCTFHFSWELNEDLCNDTHVETVKVTVTVTDTDTIRPNDTKIYTIPKMNVFGCYCVKVEINQIFAPKSINHMMLNMWILSLVCSIQIHEK